MKVDFVFLTRLATRFTQAERASACVVSAFAPDGNLWGSVGKRPDGMFEMKLSPNQPPAEFAFTFWHELGHLVRHGAIKPIDAGGIGLNNVHRMQDPEQRESMRTFLVKREDEADEWARMAAAAFEREAGMTLERYLFG